MQRPTEQHARIERTLDDTGLPDHGQLPEFTLVGDDGKPFTRKELTGDVWVVDFIFTRCGVTCGKMSDVYAALLEEQLGARFLSVTVDPREAPSLAAWGPLVIFIPVAVLISEPLRR